MQRRTLFSLLTALGVAGVLRPAQAAVGLVVFVHPKNPVGDLGRGELEAIFTTRKLYWPNGGRIQAFNFPAKHETRVAFDQEVLGMNPDETARYWIDRRVRGGHRPPRQLPSASHMVRVVEKLEGAIGYAAPSDLSANVKVIAKV